LISKKDPIPWNNVYGTILGTFGNPNFISAFLGLFVVALFAIFVDAKIKLPLRVLSAIGILVSVYEIIETSSIQGLVVVVLGISIVLGVYLKFQFKNNKFNQLDYIRQQRLFDFVINAKALYTLLFKKANNIVANKAGSACNKNFHLNLSVKKVTASGLRFPVIITRYPSVLGSGVTWNTGCSVTFAITHRPCSVCCHSLIGNPAYRYGSSTSGILNSCSIILPFEPL
jgi:hypothetical protein